MNRATMDTTTVSDCFKADQVNLAGMVMQDRGWFRLGCYSKRQHNRIVQL